VSGGCYPDIAAAVTEAQRAELEDSARAVLGEVRTDYLSSTRLQQLTGIPASTWRYWAINGVGPRSFKLGRRRVWRRSDVLAWIEQQDAVTGTGGDGA
jgi:predicted DNA-binding transcriptional regulator AlpA